MVAVLHHRVDDRADAVEHAIEDAVLDRARQPPRSLLLEPRMELLAVVLAGTRRGRAAPRRPTSSCRPPSVTKRNARPASGASGVDAIRSRTAPSIAAWTSSSRTRSATATAASSTYPARRSALTGWHSQFDTRVTTPAPRRRSITTSRVRNVSSMNSPSVSPNCCLRSTTIAVWGIGMPSGCRNSAVTANQSASPPTIDASAAACT